MRLLNTAFTLSRWQSSPFLLQYRCKDRPISPTFQQMYNHITWNSCKKSPELTTRRSMYTYLCNRRETVFLRKERLCKWDLHGLERGPQLGVAHNEVSYFAEQNPDNVSLWWGAWEIEYVPFVPSNLPEAGCMMITCRRHILSSYVLVYRWFCCWQVSQHPNRTVERRVRKQY